VKQESYDFSRGCCQSAEDADSPSGDGAFYIRSVKELIAVLGPDDGEYAVRVFSATRTGNYSGSEEENGMTVPSPLRTPLLSQTCSDFPG
jgi:uncharacterized protein YyaL (SSP411 family)